MHDALSAFFLVCFLFGAALTVVSFLTGAAHLSLPAGHSLHLQLGHAGHFHVGHGAGARESVSPLNIGSLLAFLTWFGGIGYLLHTLSPLALLFVLLLALVAGVAGASLILLFLVKVLLPAQTVVDPERYRLDGTVGRITAGITAGGTGEITYVKAGTRRGDAARSIDGEPIQYGEEVMILAYQHGIAYVQKMDKYLKTPAAEIASTLVALEEGRGASRSAGATGGTNGGSDQT